MPSVRLDFIPPNNPNLNRLRIFEGPEADGPFDMIEEVSAIGAYPNYISTYTTTQAEDILDWFAIRWVQTNGTELPLSASIHGETTTVIGEIINRVQLRYPGADPTLIAQEAEVVLELVFGTTDPDPDLITATQMSAIVQLTTARVMAWGMISSSASASYTAGLVQQKTDTSTAVQSRADLKDLAQQALAQLGVAHSVIAQMDDPKVSNGVIASVDITRLLLEIL